MTLKRRVASNKALLLRALSCILHVAVSSGWLLIPSSVPHSIHHRRSSSRVFLAESKHEHDENNDGSNSRPARRSLYDLGLDKNPSVYNTQQQADRFNIASHWVIPEPVQKPKDIVNPSKAASVVAVAKTIIDVDNKVAAAAASAKATRTRRMVARDNDSQLLRAALWDEQHYFGGSGSGDAEQSDINSPSSSSSFQRQSTGGMAPPTRPSKFYPDIDLSIPESVYDTTGEHQNTDLVWDLLRWEAYEQAEREPLLVSFMHSTILNHKSLESSLAFLLANRLQSPAMMISTQLQSLILDALVNDKVFCRSVRADIMAVRDRDPACNCLPDVFLYFKGFHALQSHRVAHRLAKQGKRVLALYLQSQVSQIFQIDIHPLARLGSGIMLDHGTGIVIGETAALGHNCSVLHHVTLGGSGSKGVMRHPQVGNGVLLGAGATVLGPVTIGDGTQVGAGTLVISDVPAHSVVVGVPARIIGSFVDVTQQPSIGMDQMMDDSKKIMTFETEGI